MSKPNWMGWGMVVLTLASCAPTATAQKLEATVLYRQNSDVNYFAVIPGYTSPVAENSPTCALDPIPRNVLLPATINSSPSKVK